MFRSFSFGVDGGADIGGGEARKEVLRSLLDKIPKDISDKCLIALTA